MRATERTAGTTPTQERPRGRRSLGARLVLLACASLTALLLAEVVARVASYWRHARAGGWQQVQAVRAPLPPGAAATLGQLVQRAADARVVYELRPDLDVIFRGVRVLTNAAGCRGPERAAAKPPHGFRIVGIGDSVMFGWGVRYEDTFLARLELRAQAACPDARVEAIALAVPGYNTAMEVAALETKGLAFAPDVVVVDFVGNDFELPNFLVLPPDWLALDRSFLWAWLQSLRGRADAAGFGPLERAPMQDGGHFESDPARVPEQYRYMVGPAGYRRALERLVALSRQHGFHVVVSCYHELLPEAAAICRELDLPVVAMAAKNQAWLAANGWTGMVGSPLTVAADDPHPSPLVHGWLGDALFELLRDRGWLPP